MESSFIQTIIDWAQANRMLAMAIAFAFAFAESLAIVGIFIPGIILLFAVGAVVGTDPLLLLLVSLSASAGALAGDGLSYWLGYRYRDRLPGLWPFSRYPDLLARGGDFITRHGGKSVFIGRFIGPLRPVVPVVAGMLGLRPAWYLAVVIPACLLWAPAYLLPGVLFGAGLGVIAEFGSRLAAVVAIVVGGIWLIVWMTRVIYETAARRSAWWLKSAVMWTRRHPRMGPLLDPVLRPVRRETLSVALLGMLLMLSLAGLLAVLVSAPLGTPPWDAERMAAGMAASLRNHFADPVFVALSLAGDLRVMASLAAAFGLLLIVLGRRNAALHWLAAIGGAWVMAVLLNAFMGLLLDRPEREPLGQVPHLGYTLATVTFGFFAVMLAKDLRARRRKWPYLTTTFLLALIGFAHFYLGRASISGLLAGLALGGGWLALTGIAYRQRARFRRHPGWLTAGFYLLFLGLASWQIEHQLGPTLQASKISQPYQVMMPDAWWTTDWQNLPARRSRFGRAGVQRFDLQLAAPLDVVHEALSAHGWRPLPPMTLAGLVAAFSGHAKTGSLPHLPRDFAGNPEDLALRLELGSRQAVVLRLWHSGARLVPGGPPVWLGQIRQVEIRPTAFVFSLWRPAAGDDAVVRLQQALPGWDWRQPADGPWLFTPQASPLQMPDDNARATRPE